MNVRRAAWGLLPTTLSLAFLAVAPGCQENAMQAAASKAKGKSAPEVLVSRPSTEEITDFEDFTGRTEAKYRVEVRARVTGYLDKVHFEDGAEVEAGAPLFDIDPRPYRAALERAEATRRQAEARHQRTEADFSRISALFARGTVSREELDAISGTFAEARAAVGVAEADRDLAELNLAFTKVTAPISGRLSRRMVDPGNLVRADETALTSIVSLDPMYLYFDVDERTLLRVRRLIREGKVKSRSEAEVPVMAALADEEDFPHRGAIDFSDNVVDPNTGTLRLRGVIDNPAPRLLSPGMFLRVRLPIGRPHQALLVAERALGTDQGRKFLYVVNDKEEVDYRPVKVGLLNDRGLRVIEEGLEPGERVIVSGVQRVRPGAKVRSKPAEDLADDRGPEARDDAPGALATSRGDVTPPTPGG